MKRYDAYKSTGIPWIPEVPEHWEVRRLGLFFSENKTANSNMQCTEAYKFNYGTLVRKDEGVDLSELAETYSKYTVLKPKDIVINGLNLNYDFITLRVAQAASMGIITSAYVVLSPRGQVYDPYFCYLFRAMDSIKLFHGMGSGIRLTLSYKDLKYQPLPLPPLSEQRAIVAYIERKERQIDTYIARQAEQIERLKELRKTIISHAVTRGIHPYTRFRPTGIPWIPEVPEHWEVDKIRKHFKQRVEMVSDKDYPPLSVTKDGILPQLDTAVKTLYGDKRKLVCQGDYVVNSRSDRKGSCGISPFDGSVSLINMVMSSMDGEQGYWLKGQICSCGVL